MNFKRVTSFNYVDIIRFWESCQFLKESLKISVIYFIEYSYSSENQNYRNFTPSHSGKTITNYMNIDFKYLPFVLFFCRNMKGDDLQG